MNNSIVPFPSDDFLCVSMFQNKSNQLEFSSSSNGMDWTPGVVPFPSILACNPVSYTFDGKLYIAYQGYGPYQGMSSAIYKLYLASTENGVDWNTNSVPIATNIGGYHCAMFSFDGAFCIIYQEVNTARLCLISSSDGSNWSTPSYVGDYATKTGPSVTVDQNTIYLVFQNNDTQQLVLTTSKDLMTWSPVSILCNQQLACNPSICVHQGELFLIYQPWADGKVVGKLYFATYGHGINWQYDSSPISTEIGGFPAVITASETGLCILYQMINSASLCCMQKSYSGSWGPTQTILDFFTLTGPAFCNIPYVYEAGRKLAAAHPIYASDDLPLPANCVAILGPDAEYNWANKPKEAETFWGFTGIVAIKDTQYGTDANPISLKAGSVIIFPGTHSPKLARNAKSIYEGLAQVNSVPTDAIYKGYDVALEPETSLHQQVCKLYMPPSYKGGLPAYIKNFIGFAFDVTVQKKVPQYYMLYNSGQLNNPYFYYLSDTNQKVPASLMSKEWRSWLAAFCTKNFQGLIER
ncbi:hypothetical protein [Janthinobacterium sp. B9-8]|uniref:hypothetical protein n=1 Tax=Janthinobacterium sp. B9-8 TaxID=1236179 RepID=UPI000A575FAF|nr:hypothetical protein [Janthinobacterium sp. B9-8]